MAASHRSTVRTRVVCNLASRRGNAGAFALELLQTCSAGDVDGLCRLEVIRVCAGRPAGSRGCKSLTMKA